MKLKKKVVYKVQVTFEADTEAGLTHAIKSFAADDSPGSSCTGCSVDHGMYAYEVGAYRVDSLGRTVGGSKPQGEK